MKGLSTLIIIVGLVELALTNSGLWSLDQPYLQRYSESLPEPDAVTAYVGVSVLPMDEERMLENQTVLVRDGVIAAIGRSDEVRVPPEARVIDGRGRYLIPGLVDMHIHIEYDSDLLLLAANGVTGIRNMWGNTGMKLRLGLPDQLVLRDQIAAGELFGPTIYTAGPVMEGDTPNHPMMEVFRTPEGARSSVSAQKAKGYDFIKVYDHLDPQTYRAILEAAKANGMQVVGHVPSQVGLEAVLAGGQTTIEHLQGYIDADRAEFLIPEAQLDEYAGLTRQAGVWNCPTLSLYPKNSQSPEGVRALQAQPGMAYQTPFSKMLTPFMYRQMSAGHTYPGQDYSQRISTLNRRMLAALHKAGAGILLCTDAAQSYHIPGFATLEELGLLVEAGLSPYEALRAGTRDAAIAMGKQDEFGTIAEGLRADLLLLEANPFEDITNVERRAGVMLRGRWMSEAELQAMLEGLEASFAPSWIERLWPAALLAVAVYMFYRHKTEQILD
jgi:imidazolonepropionase-like amidohydrolase